MSKGISETSSFKEAVSKDGAIYTLISFQELDSLTGRLMQMCELNGDREQREALKRSIKDITKDWLHSQYRNAGFDEWGHPLSEDVKAIEV